MSNNKKWGGCTPCRKAKLEKVCKEIKRIIATIILLICGAYLAGGVVIVMFALKEIHVIYALLAFFTYPFVWWIASKISKFLNM